MSCGRSTWIFFRAGAQVLQALTWWTSRSHLDKRGKEQGWGDRLEEINRTAVSGGEGGGCRRGARGPGA